MATAIFSQLCIVFLAVTFGLVLMLLRNMDFFVQIKPHNVDNCKRIEGTVVGCEDLDLLTDGRVLMSCAYRKMSSNATQQIIDAKSGHIFTLINQNYDQAVEMKINDLSFIPDFNPHGIGLREDDTGSWLYVVNHRRDGDAVEIFKIIDATTLQYWATFMDPFFTTLNDVTVTSDGSFYATNINYYQSDDLRLLLEVVTQRSWGSVVYCKLLDNSLFQNDPPKSILSTDCKLVLPNLRGPNGIVTSLDDSKIYVIVTRALHEYQRSDNGSLTISRVYDAIYSGLCDNLFVEKNGDMWTMCHPQVYKFLLHVKNNSNLAPTSVIKF